MINAFVKSVCFILYRYIVRNIDSVVSLGFKKNGNRLVFTGSRYLPFIE